MPTLFTMPETCSLAPHIAVRWTDADIDVNNMAYGDHKKADYLAVNPKGKVPALRFDDGAVLTEAAAILTYVAATAPNGDLRASDDRGRAREAEALSYMSSEVHAAYGPHFAAKAFAESAEAQSEVKDATYRKLAGHYERLNDALADSGGQWYLGHRSTADAFLYVLTRWIERTPLAIDDYAALKAFRGRMQKDKGVQAALTAQAMQAV